MDMVTQNDALKAGKLCHCEVPQPYSVPAGSPATCIVKFRFNRTGQCSQFPMWLTFLLLPWQPAHAQPEPADLKAATAEDHRDMDVSSKHWPELEILHSVGFKAPGLFAARGSCWRTFGCGEALPISSSAS